MKKILLVLLSTLLFLSCSKDNDKPTLKRFDYVYSNNEIDLYNRINDYRITAGVNPLILVNHVSYKCMEHNEYMMNNGVVNHDYFYNRSENIIKVCGATEVDEILAFNYPTNENVLNGWAGSSCHDTIIKSEHSRIGLSIRQNPDGKKYYTVIFLD